MIEETTKINELKTLLDAAFIKTGDIEDNSLDFYSDDNVRYSITVEDDGIITIGVLSTANDRGKEKDFNEFAKIWNGGKILPKFTWGEVSNNKYVHFQYCMLVTDGITERNFIRNVRRFMSDIQMAPSVDEGGKIF